MAVRSSVAKRTRRVERNTPKAHHEGDRLRPNQPLGAAASPVTSPAAGPALPAGARPRPNHLKPAGVAAAAHTGARADPAKRGALPAGSPPARGSWVSAGAQAVELMHTCAPPRSKSSAQTLFVGGC